MMDKKVDITNYYSHELMDINNKLNQLEKGRIYELSKAKMDGYLANNIDKLRGSIYDLLNKIEYGKKSMGEKIKEEYDRTSS